MSANIFGERFYARGEPGWHRLGTVFPADRHLTLVEAAIESGVAYKTKLVPVYAMMEEDNSLVSIPDRRAIVREPLGGDLTWVPLDVVGKNYRLVDNLELFHTFNELSEFFPVETIGALGRGEKVFAALDAGMVDIKGDPVHQFFTMYDGKTGRDSSRIFYSPVRVVCQNTLNAGLAEATLSLSVAHVRGNKQRLQKIADLTIEMAQRMQDVNALFGNMAETPFDLEEFKQMLYTIYPEPKPIEETTAIEVSAEFFRLKESMEQHRLAATDLFVKWNDEQPELANTQWGAWNSVVELEDWKAGRGKGQFASALFGERANVKRQALAAIRNA